MPQGVWVRVPPPAPNNHVMKKTVSLFAAALLCIASLRAEEFIPAPPEKVNIPDTCVSLLDFGGVPDGVTLNTEAFQKAVSALAKKGGGHLIVPEGVFLTGPISLKDCMDLHLESGAVILMSPDKRDFLDGGSVRPGISASKRHDVSISGDGIIDGNGEWWRPAKRSKNSETEWRELLRKGGTVTKDGSLWYPFALRHFPNIAPSPKAQESLRTHLVRFTSCERVLVSGVTLQNSPKFHLVPRYCTDVTIEGVQVRCPWNAQNGDGIDIMQCRRVLVTGCRVDVGDDGICLKGGVGKAAAQGGPCKDILIENNIVFRAHGGFVMGSEISGGMQDIVVRHNTFSGTDTGLRFKSAPERGGKTSGIWISDINMTGIKGEAIVFQTDYADRPAGHDDNVAPNTENFLPEFADFHISGIRCSDCATAIRAKGRPSMVHDIRVSDSVFFFTERDCDIDHPGMVELSGVVFKTY